MSISYLRRKGERDGESGGGGDTGRNGEVEREGVREGVYTYIPFIDLRISPHHLLRQLLRRCGNIYFKRFLVVQLQGTTSEYLTSTSKTIT